jgi:methionyl-tRNA synthetase
MIILIQSRLNLKLKSTTLIKHFSTKHYFVTTPIFYVNANPHIGHLHSTLLADVYTRYAALKHPPLPPILCTGTDEHGLKIQRVAQEKGIPPGELCDSVSLRFKVSTSFTLYQKMRLTPSLSPRN